MASARCSARLGAADLDDKTLAAIVELLRKDASRGAAATVLQQARKKQAKVAPALVEALSGASQNDGRGKGQR
jgi:hypothetical protein